MNRKITPYLFLAFPLTLFVVFVIGPALYSIFLSLTKWDLLNPPKFIGLKNYMILINDPIFKLSFVNSVKWTALFSVVPILLGLLLALSLDSMRWGSGILKPFFYAPMTISLVAVSRMWLWIYDPKWGILNSLLKLLGLESLTRIWLGDPKLALYSLSAAAIWGYIPFVTILFLVGLKNIPVEILETAKIDGAGSYQLLYRIKIPLLQPAYVIVISTTIINSLRTFDIIYATTAGGPAHSTRLLSLLMFFEAFHNYRMGYGAAVAVILTLITSVFIVVYLNRVVKTEISYY